MRSSPSRTTTHSIRVGAATNTVFNILSEPESWPLVFEPTLHLEVLDRTPSTDQIRIWAQADDRVMSWSSRRSLDPTLRTIAFRQEESQAPVKRMQGKWSLTELGPRETLITLDHHFTAVGPDEAAWVESVVDANSRRELAALASATVGGDRLRMSFTDTLDIEDPFNVARGFIDDANLWPDRLPHVDSVDFSKQSGGIQHLSMQTLGPDGSKHETSSIRISLDNCIAYKQVSPPPLLKAHVGRWTFRRSARVTTVESYHAVMLDEQRIEEVLGTGSTIQDARDYVRNALGGNSRATLKKARQFAETYGT